MGSSMETETPTQANQLTNSLAQCVEANRADLISRYHRSLQENLFSNRSEVRPRDLASIATKEVETFVSFLRDPSFPTLEHGSKFCERGLSEQTLLGLAGAT